MLSISGCLRATKGFVTGKSSALYYALASGTVTIPRIFKTVTTTDFIMTDVLIARPCNYYAKFLSDGTDRWC